MAVNMLREVADDLAAQLTHGVPSHLTLQNFAAKLSLLAQREEAMEEVMKASRKLVTHKYQTNIELRQLATDIVINIIAYDKVAGDFRL